MYREKFGGFVRPSGLAINKMKLLSLVHLWSCSPLPSDDGEDRLIFDRLRGEEHACTGNATVYCALDSKDGMHETRLAYMAGKGVSPHVAAKAGSVRLRRHRRNRDDHKSIESPGCFAYTLVGIARNLNQEEGKLR